MPDPTLAELYRLRERIDRNQALAIMRNDRRRITVHGQQRVDIDRAIDKATSHLLATA